jgi:hypothetical protein
LDYYKEVCSGWEGQLFCPRGSETPDDYHASDYEWAGYEWGHRYELQAYWVEVDAEPDGPSRELHVEQVLEDVHVPAGSRFTLPIDPTSGALGFPEHIEDDLQAGTRRINSGPNFTCTTELCSELTNLSFGGTAFDATFEFDADLGLSLVALEPQPDVTTTLASYMQQLRGEWQELAPSQYVVKVCDTGFSVPSCTLAAVDAGVVTSAEVQSLDGPWTVTTLETEPLEVMFTQAASATEFEAEPSYHYVLSYTQRNFSESWGKRVTCFVPDSQQLEDCRDVE